MADGKILLQALMITYLDLEKSCLSKNVFILVLLQCLLVVFCQKIINKNILLHKEGFLPSATRGLLVFNIFNFFDFSPKIVADFDQKRPPSS